MDVIGALLWWVLAAAAALLLHRWEAGVGHRDAGEDPGLGYAIAG